ncbi:MAG: hypothetical protein R3183_11610 [Oleiphilaceae bacterium]|nr:hypothetical protein [Oleiphilaceae bacterium]
MNPRFGFFLICSVLLAVGLFRVSLDTDPRPQGGAETEQTSMSAIPNASRPLPSQKTEPAQTKEHTERDRVTAYLREKFGGTMVHAHTRVKALEKLVAYLKANYPDSWREQLADYLNEVFPEYAEAMLALFSNMEAYNQWVLSERQNMLQMSPAERRELMWQMRYSFFGDAANQIWSEALKNEQVAQSLERINSDDRFDDNSSRYIASIKQAYGDESPKVLEHRRQEFSDRFLSHRVVQQQLKSMDKVQRKQALAEFRRQLGMDEDAIARWEFLDETRDLRWQQGENYMLRRAELEHSLSESEFDVALAELQNELFGAEAEIIRNEEASGYFRYAREQVIGKN